MTPQLNLAIMSALVCSGAAFWDVCPQGPVGSCMEMGCSPTRGPTECDAGTCNCIAGYCRYPNSRIHVQPRRCRAQVPDSSCHLTRICYKGGLMSSSCVQGRCLCRTGMHIGPDGACADGWWPSCHIDTKGTCHWLDCSSSRGPTECISGKCLCKGGTCAQDGVCVDPTASLLNATPPALALAEDPEVIRAEDWEVTLNLALAAAFVGLPAAMMGGGALWLWRLRQGREGGAGFREKLLVGAGAVEE